MIRSRKQIDWKVEEIEFVCDGPTCDTEISLRTPGDWDNWEHFSLEWFSLDGRGYNVHLCSDACLAGWVRAVVR